MGALLRAHRHPALPLRVLWGLGCGPGKPCGRVLDPSSDPQAFPPCPGPLQPFLPGSAQKSTCSDWLCHVPIVARPRGAHARKIQGFTPQTRLHQARAGVSVSTPGTWLAKQSSKQDPRPHPQCQPAYLGTKALGMQCPEVTLAGWPPREE